MESAISWEQLYAEIGRLYMVLKGANDTIERLRHENARLHSLQAEVTKPPEEAP